MGRPTAQVLPGLRCNHSHSWILSPSVPLLISYFDRQLTLSTFKISAQGIWVGRHWDELSRSELLFQILQPHNLAWKRQIECISATLPSTASHLLLSFLVGKFRFWGTELCLGQYCPCSNPPQTQVLPYQCHTKPGVTGCSLIWYVGKDRLRN